MLGFVDRWIADHPGWEVEFLVPDAEGLLVEQLTARGWAFRVIHSYPWALRHAPADLRTRVRYGRHNARAVAELRALMAERRYRVVLTNTLVNPWGAVAAALEGIPHVWFPREYGDLDHGYEFQFGVEQTWTDIARLSELVVFNSQAIADYAWGYMGSTPHVVQRPVIESAVADRLLALDAPAVAAPLQLLIAGKISPSKGQLDAIEAVRRVVERGVDVELDIVGPAPREQNLAEVHKTVAAAGLSDRVRVSEPRVDLVETIGRSHVGLVLSSWEAYGRVTLEFQLSARPVIGYERGGTPEIVVNGETGSLVSYGDIDALVDAIEVFAHDHERVTRFGVAARQRARVLNLPADIVPRIEQAAAARPRSVPEVMMSGWELAEPMWHVLEGVRRGGPVRRLRRYVRQMLRKPLPR